MIKTINKISHSLQTLILVLCGVIGLQNQSLHAQAGCAVVDTVCIDGTTEFFVNYDGTSTYSWSTDNGATLTVPAGDTLVMVDWSTSSVVNGLDSVCLMTDDPTCEICRVSYIDSCEPECADAAADLAAFCAFIAANPTSSIALDDCDGGGVDNATECASGDDPTDPNDDYDCDNLPAMGFDICDYITTNPDSDLATLDCDGGGVTNASECANGGDPLDDSDECIALNALGTDICGVLAINPTSPIGALDCDDGGVDNATECANGGDPSDTDDDYNCDNIPAQGFDICDFITNNPNSNLATLDCDGGGVDNATECTNGDDPTDPNDDYDCDSITAAGVDICSYIAANPGANIASLDCDAGGVDNQTECANGDDPTDPVDDYDCDEIITDGVDICAYLVTNPTSVIATLDCDGGGVDNGTECANGDDPTDPADDYDCDSIVADGVDICAYITANPTAAIATLDCDGGGVDNATECANGDDPTDPADDYDCDQAVQDGLDICAYITANPTSELATLDCDGGGVDNATECTNGDDPGDPADDYDCDSIAAAGVDICSYIAANPGANIASLDCDNGGVDNQTECANGDDPNDPSDDADCATALANGDDICAIIAANPSSVLATADCDGGGVDNATECANGDDPADPDDDYDCDSIVASGVDICGYITANPTAAIATLDCDGGGVDNATECANGDDPTDPADDYDCDQTVQDGLDICAYITANPTSELATLDCDGGGVDNATECANGDDPSDPADDYDCDNIAAAGVDICSYIAANPGSNLASLDCDAGGVDNQTECANGDDPNDPSDDADCATALANGDDICAIIAANPSSVLATADCDGGGVDNATECANGDDPADPDDDYDCDSIVADGVDICGYITANPTAAIATLDCDGGGVDNATECANGDDPSDPDDDYDCDQAVQDVLDICAYIAANPTSELATLDCDGGGVDNATECANGDDPSDPADDYDCDNIAAAGVDICSYIAANPGANIASLDCDNGGVDNQTECANGDDPNDPVDDLDCDEVINDGIDICAYLTANPSSVLAILDCDGGGVDNATECANGDDPNDPADDYGCDEAIADGVNICGYIAVNPTSALAALDCDGGGVNNATECANGDDPTDPDDDYDCDQAVQDVLDICAYITANPTSQIATLDCDGGGVDNATECANGDDPNDPADDYDCDSIEADGVDICSYIAANPASDIASLDCDNGGVDNQTECANGDDPNDPSDDSDCTTALANGDDICAIIAANPSSVLATADCDGGGVDNATECANGDDPSDPDDDYDCDQATTDGIDICLYINANPTSDLATLDCDNGGVDNATECANGDDPSDPNDDYGCDQAAADGIDICAYLNSNPNAVLATLDCDGGGVDNATECANGDDPSDPSDDCNTLADLGTDICALILADPTNPIATADCDGGGISNGDECASGEDPSDPSDDCDAAIDGNIDICAIMAGDATHPMATLDCDGGGIDNITECNSGEDPSDPSDDCTAAEDEGVDICALIAADPTNGLATADCDAGGVDNATECASGDDPFDPSDDCDSAIAEGVDICAAIAADPTSALATADCDGGGIDNATECAAGDDPSDPDDDSIDCAEAIAEGVDICATLLADPTSDLATLDCDGGGIDNATECASGQDPSDPGDDCQTAIDEGLDLCAIIGADPSHPLATADCDGGGIDNLTECNSGEDPLDPSDDCTSAEDEGVDICALIAADPTSPMATQDCDGGGIINSLECDEGGDPFNGADDCSSADGIPGDFCTYVIQNPTSDAALADCDGGGVNNYNECINGEDPFDNTDDCQAAQEGNLDICTYVIANPTSLLATSDCDNGGVSNYHECISVEDPLYDPDDDCATVDAENLDICALLVQYPNSTLHTADCDGGGVDNATECAGGGDPSDPDDDTCDNAETSGYDICTLLLANPGHHLATEDCDGGGIDNLTECGTGEDPFDPADDCTAADEGGVDICALIAADPNNVFAALDCDAGGMDNATECASGGDPHDPDDDSCANAEAAGYDLCALILANPTHPLATEDCDGGGIDNLTECESGEDPFDPSDDCTAAIDEAVDICALIAADPSNALASTDCDGGGIDNQTECDNGGDPGDPVDDSCDNMEAENYDICTLLAANPGHPLASQDCDNGGVLNSTECDNGGDPFDPIDDCGASLDNDGDICAIIAADPSSPIATLDCDGGGIDNATECANGNDPSDPSDECDAVQNAGLNLCLLIAGNPSSPLATADCDGGGLDNITECENQEDPFDSSDECDPFLESDLDLCEFLAANPGNALADADCDGGGISNGLECDSGGDPLDPIDDGCDNFGPGGLDICEFITANPGSPIGSFDCDGGGIDNTTECSNGDDPFDSSDDCDSAEATGTDICALIAADPAHPMASQDCDGGGIDNATECASGENPFDPADDCQTAADEGIDICTLIAADPTNGLATADCDGGGVDNATECAGGFDPFDQSDECAAGEAQGADICTFILANPTSTIATLDCDGGGIDNLTECASGQNPFDSGDDCAAADASGFDLCAELLVNPTHPLANLDCDGGGITNAAECASGENPFDHSDDCKTAVDTNLDLCAMIGADPSHPFAGQDCDGGGVNNIIECFSGNDPLNPSDDCESAEDEGLDICALIAINPTSGLASSDCDGGGIINAIECSYGNNPFDSSDDCKSAEDSGTDICALIAADPTHPLAILDCDGGGIDNATECATGADPFAEGDDFACESAENSGVDVCALIATDPTIPLAALDCDGGGVDNATECANGGNPFDTSDDCQSILSAGIDICVEINGDPNHPFASLDCDGGGIDNLTECINHTDPSDMSDDCTAACAAGIDIHVLIGGNPNHPMAQIDCDGGGVSNFDECIAGQDACDPLDDCATAAENGTICTLVAADPTSAFALADCDGGGVDNATECAAGNDPSDPTDDCDSFVDAGGDLCAMIDNDVTHPFAQLDCDGGGVPNIVECQEGTDPSDPVDDCQAAIDADILCALINGNPVHPLAQLDCDGGGVSNIIECQSGTQPGNAPGDDCQAAVSANLDLCVLINGDANHPLAQLDCDGGGVTNFIECQTGEEPGQTPEDDCDAAVNANLDLCVLINGDANHPLAQLDCDGGGVTNFIECQTGEEPGQTPEDDCDAAVNANLDLCVLINGDANHPFAQQDCDGGGVTNIVECQTGEEPGQTPGDDCQSAIDADLLTTLIADASNPLYSADCDGDGTPNGEDDDPLDPCVDYTIFDAELCDDNQGGQLNECAINTFVFLEGSLIGIGLEVYSSQMRTDLNDIGLLPGQTPITGFSTPTPDGHPYSGAPWNHNATTGIGFTDADYPSDVTDWVLVELRSDLDASSNICTHAGFVHSDGRVTFPDGCACNVTPGQEVHIVIKHRNHLPIISPLVTVDNTGQATFDFRTNDSYRLSPFDVGQIPLPGGIFAMVAANGDQTVISTSQSDIDTNDKQVWLDRNSDNDMYSPADYDMNGDVNSNDKFVWLKNNLTSGTLTN